MGTGVTVTDLRDHGQPCEHEVPELGGLSAVEAWPGTWMCNVSRCPGGRVVTIDYEAARRAAVAVGAMIEYADESDTIDSGTEATIARIITASSRIVDAAIVDAG